MSFARSRQPSPRHPRPRTRPDQTGRSSASTTHPPLVAGHSGAAHRVVGPGPDAPALGIRPSSEGQELICGGIGLILKSSLAVVACVSLVRLAGAYQQRLDRYGEVSAVHDIQQAKLLKARNRFDSLFATGGEQKLLKEQDQWIAPNRLRVVWSAPAQP